MTEQEATRKLNEVRKTRDPSRTEVNLSSDGVGLSIGKVKTSLSEMRVLYRLDSLEPVELFYFSVLGTDEPSEALKSLAQRLNPHEDSDAYWRHWANEGGFIVAENEALIPVGFLGFGRNFRCETGPRVDSIPKQEEVERGLVQCFQALVGRNPL